MSFIIKSITLLSLLFGFEMIVYAETLKLLCKSNSEGRIDTAFHYNHIGFAISTHHSYILKGKYCGKFDFEEMDLDKESKISAEFDTTLLSNIRMAFSLHKKGTYFVHLNMMHYYETGAVYGVYKKSGRFDVKENVSVAYHSLGWNTPETERTVLFIEQNRQSDGTVQRKFHFYQYCDCFNGNDTFVAKKVNNSIIKPKDYAFLMPSHIDSRFWIKGLFDADDPHIGMIFFEYNGTPMHCKFDLNSKCFPENAKPNTEIFKCDVPKPPIDFDETTKSPETESDIFPLILVFALIVVVMGVCTYFAVYKYKDLVNIKGENEEITPSKVTIEKAEETGGFKSTEIIPPEETGESERTERIPSAERMKSIEKVNSNEENPSEGKPPSNQEI